MNCKQLKDRYIELCVRNARENKAILRRHLGDTPDFSWEDMTTFLSGLLQVIGIMQRTFDADRIRRGFGRGEDREDVGEVVVNAKLIQEAHDATRCDP